MWALQRTLISNSPMKGVDILPSSNRRVLAQLPAMSRGSNQTKRPIIFKEADVQGAFVAYDLWYRTEYDNVHRRTRRPQSSNIRSTVAPTTRSRSLYHRSQCWSVPVVKIHLLHCLCCPLRLNPRQHQRSWRTYKWWWPNHRRQYTLYKTCSNLCGCLWQCNKKWCGYERAVHDLSRHSTIPWLEHQWDDLAMKKEKIN